MERTPTSTPASSISTPVISFTPARRKIAQMMRQVVSKVHESAAEREAGLSSPLTRKKSSLRQRRKKLVVDGEQVGPCVVYRGGLQTGSALVGRGGDATAGVIGWKWIAPRSQTDAAAFCVKRTVLLLSGA